MRHHGARATFPVILDPFQDQRVGNRGHQVQRCIFGDRPERSGVRRHHDVMRFGHRGDLLHLRDAAGASGIGLDDVDRARALDGAEGHRQRAVVQGGLTTTMDLVAAGRPFLFLPLQGHFEQNVHVVSIACSSAGQISCEVSGSQGGDVRKWTADSRTGC